MTACQCAGGQPECQSWCLCPGSGPHRFQLEVQVHDCVMVVLEQQDAVHLLVPEPSGGPGRVAVLDRREESEGPGLRWPRCSQPRPRFEPKGDVLVHKPGRGPGRAGAAVRGLGGCPSREPEVPGLQMRRKWSREFPYKLFHQEICREKLTEITLHYHNERCQAQARWSEGPEQPLRVASESAAALAAAAAAVVVPGPRRRVPARGLTRTAPGHAS